MKSERVIYSSGIPQGAGAVSGDFKPERVTAPSVRGMCFANMTNVNDLVAMRAMAPSEHQMEDNRFMTIAATRGKAGRVNPARNITVKAEHLTFSKGASVKDKKTGKRGIIIKANAGYTAKTHAPVHRLADDNGDSWLAKEKDLKLLY